MSIAVVPTSEGFLGEGSVQLHCEISGYASFSSLPTWTDGSGMPITDTPKYSIALGSGSNSLISSTGSTGPIIVSTLTIGQLSVGDEGSYSCRVETLSAVTTVRSTQLVIMDGTPVTPPVPCMQVFMHGHRLYGLEFIASCMHTHT